ncbi:hypothetical protein [Qipengyuania flava]|uniref:hypothetical protein n=1 Tax=Qipengyuania flava TaxID=192812 RepID=UPI001C632313|nr:hypothetical protein [Qipengyuania flava]QYJ06229.1 hypothetical protein KUV82_09040 [Qipengyuania flava]
MAMFLAACALSLAISLAALVLAYREPGLSWKPIWVFMAPFGLGGAAMVWSAPETLYWFFGVAVPTASFIASDEAFRPAVVRCLFPAGAALVFVRVYWHRRNRVNPPKHRSATS